MKPRKSHARQTGRRRPEGDPGETPLAFLPVTRALPCTLIPQALIASVPALGYRRGGTSTRALRRPMAGTLFFG